MTIREHELFVCSETVKSNIIKLVTSFTVILPQQWVLSGSIHPAEAENFEYSRYCYWEFPDGAVSKQQQYLPT